jgi:hypothetical protein
MKENNQYQTTVSTFLEEDTLDMIYDGDKLDKWHSMVSELGLEGQTKIVTAKKSPIPFLFMNKTLVNVIETLCPRKVALEAFSASPIPVEILDLVALSKKEGYFEKISIWYDDKSPDPACVGSIFTDYWSQNNNGNLQTKFQTKEEAQAHNDENGWDKKPYPSGEQMYLIGKWGDIKMSLQDMTDMACKRYMRENSVEYKKRIKEYERKLSDLEIEAAERFGTAPENQEMPF